jgi:octaprenyl-diphosphate synthase
LRAKINIAAIKKRYQLELEEYNATFRSIMSSNIKLIDTVAKYVVRHKGKNVRPLLVIMSAKLVGEPTPNTYIVASIVELLHSASLIHDDVVDDANIRRGFPSINAVWKNKVAVLMGDYLLSKCLIGATKTGQLEIFNLLSDTAKRLAKGELLQIERSRKLNITETDYFQVISDKTAALISAAAELGARSSSTNSGDHEQLRMFGEYLGISFQIKDDLIDYLGSQKLVGKPVGNDLKEKKLTLPLIHAFKHASAKEVKAVKKTLKRGAKSKDINQILKFVNEYKGIEYAIGKQDEYAQKAKDSLSIYPDSATKESLLQFVDYITQRNK